MIRRALVIVFALVLVVVAFRVAWALTEMARGDVAAWMEAR